MAEPHSGVEPNDEHMLCDDPTTDNEFGLWQQPTEENPAEKVEEWTILVKLVTKNSSDGGVNIAKIHREIISKMRKADPTVSIQTIDGAIITTDEDFPSGDSYGKQFEMKETKAQFTATHKVFSTKSLDEIKRDSKKLIDYLYSNNVYIDTSASGSITEILLGPIFGIHPDNTNKRRLEKDICKLIAVHQNWDEKLNGLQEEAKLALTFEGLIPAFQLRTRRIKRKINDNDYSAKAVGFVCAIEHRKFWEALLVAASAEGWLNTIGRFYLLSANDKSEGLRLAISWHNSTLNALKATIIRGIDSTVMDAGVVPPHDNKTRPTLREKLHSGGGFITIVSTNEKDKWFGITTQPEVSKAYVNTILKDLCSSIYDDGTMPIASATEKIPKKNNMYMSNKSERNELFDTQCKSWAELTKGHNADEATTHSESNIARRPPRTVFISKVRFGDKREIDMQTQSSANDNQMSASVTESTTNMTTVTNITQDDLTAMEQRINIRNDQQKKESDDALSTAISALSAMSESATEASQATFLANLDSRWDKQEIQIEQHNAQMQSTMNSMQEMMNAMKQFVQAATAQAPNHFPSPSPSWSDPGSDPDRRNDDDSMFDSESNDFVSAAEYDDETATEDTLVIHRRSKRKPVKSPDLSRETKTTGGRGSVPRSSEPEKDRRPRRTNLENRFAPLAESEDNSLGGPS